MKKVLIITYYWPPKGGVGVQRWLKLTKYLIEHNLELIVYTPENGGSVIEDKSLLNTIPADLKVLKRKIFEPQKITRMFTGKPPSADILLKKNNGIFQSLILWIRANFFIPDTRCFWISPSIKFLSNYLTSNNIDVIISSGPPHSMHMIAHGLKKRHNIKWIADFRDPWTDIEYFDTLPLLAMSRAKHKKLEREVVQNADVLLTVSKSWSELFNNLGAQKTSVLTNGYDLDDYSHPSKESASNIFKIGHFGLYNKLRDHSFLWKTIQKISKTHTDFHSNLEFLFAGEVHDNFMENISTYQYQEKLQHYSYLSHGDSIKNMMQCDLLLVAQGQTKSVSGRLPAKVFEYLGARKPILAIGAKDSDLEKLLEPISYAWFVDFDNSKLLYDSILEIYETRHSKEEFNDDITCFSRESQAKQVVNLINEL